MQISQSHDQTSFGINSIKFKSEYAKEVWAKATKKIPSESMSKVLEEVRNIKPKVGPDIDTFIGVHSEDFCGSYLHVGAKEEMIQNLGKRGFFSDEDKITPKSIIKAFKDLVKNVNKNRMEKINGSNVPDDLLGK